MKKSVLIIFLFLLSITTFSYLFINMGHGPKERTKTMKTYLKIVTGSDGKKAYDLDASLHALATCLDAVLGKLLIPSGNYTLRPGLLENYSYNVESKTYNLELRKDLHFHNGRPIDSRDLEFSLVRGFFSKKGAFSKAFLNSIEGIKKIEGEKYRPGIVKGVQIVNKYTVAVTLISPNPAFLQALTYGYFSLVPKEELEDDLFTWKKYPVGAGNYRVVGEDNSSGLVKLEKVNQELTGVDFIELSSSGVDEETDILFSSVLDPDKMRNPKLFMSDYADSITSLWFNFNNDIGKDKNFRKAIQLVIDRNKLVKGVPHFNPSNQIIGSHLYGRIENFSEPNLEEAKAYLAKVDKNKINKEFSIPIRSNAYNQPYVEILEKQLEEIGLRIKFYPSDIKWSKPSDIEPPFRILALGAAVGDPLFTYSLFFGKDSPLNPHFPKDTEEIEALYNKAIRAATLEEKSKIIQEIGHYIDKEAIVVPLFERKVIVYYREDTVSGLGNQDNGLGLSLERLQAK